jgi:hypothetical protein
MNSRNRCFGAATLALFVSLSISPLMNAAEGRNAGRGRGYREKDPNPIVRVIKKVRSILNRIAGQDEYPVPPIP